MNFFWPSVILGRKKRESSRVTYLVMQCLYDYISADMWTSGLLQILAPKIAWFRHVGSYHKPLALLAVRLVPARLYLRMPYERLVPTS